LPLSLALHLEEVCARFEAAWQKATSGGAGPRPDEYLASAPNEGRQALVRELFRIDLSYRREAGELLDPEACQQRFPELERGWLLSALAAATATMSLPPRTKTADEFNAKIPPFTATPVSTPARFDDYELLGEIARGGMGVVYKARQLSLNRTVALKMILERGRLPEEAVQRFHREAQAAAALDHPNIVAIHASGQHDGRPFFVMAYVEGDSLQQVVRQQGLPTPQRAAELMLAVTEAISFAHRHGIIHRDLKPVNVLIDRQGRPRITDFGLAYQPESSAALDRLTHTGQVLGTPSYMSPEQAMTKHETIGPATDVYGLGGILYFLLTGQPPFQGRSATEVLCQVVMEPPKPPRQLNPQASAELEAVCLRCLEKDPAARYPSADALAEALRAAVVGPAGPATGPSESPVKTRKKSRRMWVVMAVVLVAGVAAGLWLTASSWWPRTATILGLRSPAAARLEPPEHPRLDFGLSVALLRQPLNSKEWDAPQPGPDGLIRLRNGEVVKFRIKVAQEAYVGIWSLNADGTIDQLFPNKREKEHLFAQNEEREVPATRARAKPSGGADWIWVQASTRPWSSDDGQPADPFRLYKTEEERAQFVKDMRGVQLDEENPYAEAVVRFQVEP
jgi:serine/threonine protein kinase